MFISQNYRGTCFLVSFSTLECFPTYAMSVIWIKRPVSTIPGTDFNLCSNSAGLSTGPKSASMMTFPLSVITGPTFAFHSLRIGLPLILAILRITSEAAKGSVSTGTG